MSTPTRIVAVAAACLWLVACTFNDDELDAVQRALNLELAQKQELAQNLNERRREMDVLELRLAEASADLAPGLDARVVDGPPGAAPLAPTATPAPPMPDESWLEGSGAARKRQQIAETRRRIAELEKIIGEVNNIDKRKREVEEKLNRLGALRRAKAR